MITKTHLTRFSLFIVFTALMFTMTSCKKIEEWRVSYYDDEDWHKEEINSLLTYIPADSPMVIVSTRQFNLHHTFYEKLAKNYDKKLDAENEYSYMQTKNMDLDEFRKVPMPEDDPPKYIHSFSSIFYQYGDDLITDFSDNAAIHGLNPNHMDAAIYLDEDQIVGKFTIDNRESFISGFKALYDKRITSKIFFQYKTIQNNDQEWIIVTVYQNPTDNPNKEKIQAALKDKCQEFKDSDKEYKSCLYNDAIVEKWLNYNYPVSGPKSIDVALHIGQNVVTILPLVDDKDIDKFNKYLTPAKQSLTKSDLKNISDDTAMVGYIHTNDWLKALLTEKNKPFFEAFWHNSFTPGCIDEIHTLAEDYPEISFKATAHDTHASIETTIQIKDQNQLNKLKNYHANGPQIPPQEMSYGIHINADMSKLLPDFLTLADNLSKREFQCEMFNPIKEYTPKLPDFLESLPMFLNQSTLTDLSHLTIYTKHLGIENKDTEVFMSLSGGGGLDFSIGFIQGFLIFDESAAPLIKALSEQNKVSKAVWPSHKDGEDDTPIKVLRTATNLTIATDDYDIDIDDLEPKYSNTLFTLYLGKTYISDMLPTTDRAEDLMEANKNVKTKSDAKKMIKYFRAMHEAQNYDKSLSVGTTQNGIKISFGVDL